MNTDKFVSLRWLIVLALLTPWIQVNAAQVSIMSYNAENLFDTLKDEGKKDWTYLPKSFKDNSPEVQAYCKNLRNGFYRKTCLNLDWNKNVLYKKIKNLAKVIKIADNGNSPDIVVMQEVENMRVLKMLRDIGLKGEGYKYLVLIEGPDSRGIDNAILSKIPLASTPRYHKVDLSEAFPGRDRDQVRETRGILEARFKLGRSKFTVLGNHWPSQNNSDATRFVTAKKMQEIASKINTPVIATGDFNTHPSDEPHGINTYVLNDNRSTSFWDAELVFYDEQKGRIHYNEGNEPHRGTHHYNGKWTSLDRIFVMKNSYNDNCGWFTPGCFSPDWESYETIKKDFMLKDVTFEDDQTGDIVTYYGVPNRFNAKTGEGYSDHLPVILRFNVK